MALYPQRGFTPVKTIVTDQVKATELTIGKVVTNAPDQPAGASITGDAPKQYLNLAIPKGLPADAPPPTSMSIGEVKTVPPGSAASASMGGTAPNQYLNLSLPQGMPGDTGAQGPAGPQGPAGTNATPVNFETVSAKVVTAGTTVSVTFAKKYTVPPIVTPNPVWNGDQVVIAQASEVTTTGCKVIVKQSVGTLILNGSPFGNAPANVTASMFVIGN